MNNLKHFEMTDPIPLGSQTGQAADLLKTLSHPQRLMILCVLTDNPGTESGQLSQIVGLNASATSRHLTRMRNEGLIKGVRQAKFIRYHIKDKAVASLVRALKSIYWPGE